MAIPNKYIDKIKDKDSGESRPICPPAEHVSVDNENFEGETLDEVLDEVARSIEEAGQGGYAPPQGGIPKTDLAKSVQDSLDKADSALQDEDVAEVAKTGSYNDLKNKPTIPDTSNLATKTELATKQDKISAGNGIVIAQDGKTVSVAESIRTGAAAGATAYQKPASGIPASDIASGVIPSLPQNIVQSVTINSGNPVTPDNNGNVDLGNVQGQKGDKGDKGDTVVLDPSQVEQFEIINGLNSTTAGDALDASQGTRLKNAILTLLESMANTAFIGTKPTADDLGLATVSFAVSLNIGTGANASNESTRVYEDAAYANTITADTGYLLTSVSVIHNEQTVQTSIVNNECVISIPHVAGAISITVVAQQVAAVNSNLIGCTSSNATTGAAIGSSYSATLSPTQGNTLTGGIIHVIMNNVDVTQDVYSNGVITINSVTGDIEITAIAVDSTYGYVAGMAMHLDGIDKGDDANAWTDLVGGLKFTNHGATKGTNCWTMSGGQWLGDNTLNGNAIFNRDISTIEAVFTGDSSRGANICNLGSPSTDHGISLEIGYTVYGVPTADGKAWDAQGAGTFGNSNIHCLSLNKNIYVDNGTKKTNKKSGYSDVSPTSGYWIGRDTASDWSRHRGNIYAIRIYERLLTEEEIMHNQAIDYTRFINPS